jgi:hypothetical protein
LGHILKFKNGFELFENQQLFINNPTFQLF